MAKADIQVTVSGGEFVNGQMRFDPGSTLQADIQISPQVEVKYRAIRVTLGWHTEGYGNRDQADVNVSFLAQAGVLQPGTQFFQRVTFSLPKEPWSYAGELINIVWHIKATIDIALAKDIVAEEDFILAPRQAQSPHEYAQG